LRLLFVLFALLAQAASPPQTDLDRFMARALQRRDVDRQALSDYVLDETESFEVLGPGRMPISRMQRDYTWFVQDGIHVRSPLKVDGVPVPESDRRKYEQHWIDSEKRRREFRTKRDEKRASEGLGPALSAPSINEPRFVAESYFMDFKFEPGNYYLAGKDTFEGQPVLKIDYVPTKLFNDDHSDRIQEERAVDAPHKTSGKDSDKDKSKPRREQTEKEKARDEQMDRKMEKTSQVTLWVDPASSQIVKYTFDNVWMDFLPVGWLVKVDDLKAQMQMAQPFAGVWLPKTVTVHAGATIALGSVDLQYRREFSNYRKADVTSKIRVPK
jgi:hypothetical protein